VDLSRNAFCTDELCGFFTQQDDTRLIDHCGPKSGEKPCSPFTGSTAGPFIGNDDLVIDRMTGSIKRAFSGWVGDRVARHFAGSY
jgi:hypothetical protein